MKPLKSILFSQYKIILLLTASMFLSIFLLMIRMKITHSFTYIFLVWNLFLAIIPFAITIYLKSRNSMNKFGLGFWFLVWLLFLPNAPYIITDLLHLNNIDGAILWLDVLLITSFAYNGLILFFLSIRDMQKVIRNHFSKTKTNYIIHMVFLLTGFGIYLGRFLRYNSWDILQDPFALLGDISAMVFEPKQHLQVWLFTFSFGSFLAISYWMFRAFQKRERV